MSKITTLAGIAVAAAGLMSVSAGSAFAMGCLTNDLPPMSLSHYDMVNNQGSGYNKDEYDAEHAKGNTYGTTQQSYNVTNSKSDSNPNQSKDHLGAGNY